MKDPHPMMASRRRTPRTGPGRPAAGESLTPDEVAEAALELIAAKGEEALTMRHLGDILGVKAMALYNHFPNREAIVDAVARLALARLPAPPAKGSWKSRLKVLSRGFRNFALESPNLFRLAMRRPTPPSSVLPQIEAVLSALADAGLAPAARAVAYQTLRLYLQAYCLWEIEEFNGGGDASGLARAAAPYPHTAATLDHIFTPDTERQFEAGIDLILRGLRPGNGR